MTAPDDLIRRDTAERAIRARQRDTEDSGIYAGLSVALQELAALPADPVAETADKRIAELEIGVREIAIMHQDDRPGIGEPSGDFDWRLRSEAQERVARALLAKGGA